MTARPGFTFCICPDGQLIREHIAALLDASQPADGKAWERHVFWGDEEPGPQFWEQLTLQGLFGTPRAVIIRNAQNMPAATWKRISAALGTPNPQCWPFLCLEVPWEKGQPKVPAAIGKLRCLSFADSRGWVWRSAGLDEHAMRAYVRRRAQELGIVFARGALEQLCAALPCDAAAIEQELAKLALFHGEPVTAEMAASAGHAPEFNIFHFMRLLQSGNAAGAWEQVTCGQRHDDGLLFPFLGLLAREARILWQLLAGERVRLHPADAAQKQALARRLGTRGLSRLFELIMLAEWQVKSGERSPAQALDALVGELTILFS